VVDERRHANVDDVCDDGGDLGYQIVGVADHTGDGKADILWWHNGRGEVWLWPMNGAALVSQSYVGAVPDTGYRIVASGDYDGDGKADILWHHATLGEVWLWPMNGATRLAETKVATVPDTGYEIVTEAGQSGIPITFAGLTAYGTPVRDVHRVRFHHLTSSPDWVASGYGAPGPAIVFYSPAGTTLSRQVQVTAAGSTFSFESVDLYSSITPIPYEITGLRDSIEVFWMTGTVPNTFGSFRAVVLQTGRRMIDALVIKLTNGTPCCPNPMGLDNIVLRR